MNIKKALFAMSICIMAAGCGNPSQNASEDGFVDSVTEALQNSGKINPDNMKWTRTL